MKGVGAMKSAPHGVGKMNQSAFGVGKMRGDESGENDKKKNSMAAADLAKMFADSKKK
jgi:hypothetical protein